MFLLPSTKTTQIEIGGFERPAIEPAELPELRVRRATAADADGIRTLAHLDDRRMPEGPYLVAEIGGEMLAAMSMPTGTVVADPFRRTADAADVLRLRAAQIAAREQAIAGRPSHSALHPAAA
jgi:hypothetical protein